MNRRSFLTLAAAAGAGACSGAVHQLPPVSSQSLGLAQAEVARAGPPRRHHVSDAEVDEVLASALQRIRPAASTLCREMSVGVCTWRFRVSDDRSLNASAGPDGLIVVNRGVVEYADNEEQVAMVIAHEIGHQMADHVATGRRNQVVGAVIGAVLLGALGAAASSGGYNSSAITQQAAKTGADVGGAVGRISFSKEQEREADYLAALILYRSGIDLDKARGFLVTLARSSGRRETGMLDTHPAGPERLAAWDRAVAEVRASRGRLPQRA
ncbi:M48 family metallopeptidase [Reyranella sp.]|uniref:M48 family metallopeptidase n=1 Tax=Reyranella sp. TaxID=1929291 RepID=UPI003BAA954D